MRQRIRSGFTLVELLIVIIVISILASIAIPKFNNAWRASSESRLRANLHEYRSAIERFHNDTGLYPATVANIRSQTSPATGLDSAGVSVAIPSGSWQGPYMKFYSSTSAIYPAYRSPSYTYVVTGSEIGKFTLNMNWLDLNGVNLRTW